MKIAFLLGSLNRGGLETLLLDVCRKLNPADFKAIALYRKGGVLQDEFERSNVSLLSLEVGKNKFKYILKLRKSFKREKITIAHAQQPLDAFYAYLASFGTNTKVVLTLHGFDFSDGGNLLHFILKRTKANFYVSKYQKKYFSEKYHLNSKRQHVIYNGIDFTKITNFKPNESSLRKEIGVNDNTVLMGMVGNFNYVRNQLFLCRFLKELKDKGLDFHFVFVGKRIESSVERYDNCVNFCNENGLTNHVSFLGVRNDVPTILSQLDAFVYATDHDTFGIAVVEAIASGIPVFVNDWEVMKEITDDGKLANLYKTDNVNDLLEKFMLFLQKQDEYVRRAKENAEIVREKYSIEKHIENLKEVYLSLH